jgi:hypothetical protein
MNLAFFSLRVAFAPQLRRRQSSFAFSAAAELSRPALADAASNSIAVPVLSLSLHWDSRKCSSILWLKAPFARKIARFILKVFDFERSHYEFRLRCWMGDTRFD